MITITFLCQFGLVERSWLSVTDFCLAPSFPQFPTQVQQNPVIFHYFKLKEHLLLLIQPVQPECETLMMGWLHVAGLSCCVRWCMYMHVHWACCCCCCACVCQVAEKWPVAAEHECTYVRLYVCVQACTRICVGVYMYEGMSSVCLSVCVSLSHICVCVCMWVHECMRAWVVINLFLAVIVIYLNTLFLLYMSYIELSCIKF